MTDLHKGAPIVLIPFTTSFSLLFSHFTIIVQAEHARVVSYWHITIDIVESAVPSTDKRPTDDNLVITVVSHHVIV